MDSAVMDVRLQTWIPVLKAQAESGLSKKAFCELHNISENTFYRWQRYLRSKLIDEHDFSEVQTNIPESEQEPTFVELPMTPDVQKSVDTKGLSFSKVVVLIGRCDLRKGIDGLSAMVRLRYNRDPLEKDTLFLFCGTRKDRLKGILWLGDRFVLLYIRLVEGSYQWPRSEEEARNLSSEEFMRLMDGFAIDPSVGKKRISKPISVKRKMSVSVRQRAEMIKRRAFQSFMSR